MFILKKDGAYQESDIVRIEEHVVEGRHYDYHVPASPPGRCVSYKELETRDYQK